MSISIKQAKQIREQLQLTHIIIFGISEDGSQHVATHGKSQLHAKEAANMGNQMKKQLDWPAEHCKSQPIKRVCENCSFWQRDHIDHSCRIPDNWPGQCLYEPTKIRRYAEDISCSHFEPNC